VTAPSSSIDSRIRRASDFRARSSTTRRIPASLEPLLLDSGGFTELKHHGRWRSTAAEFVAEIRTLVGRLGRGAVVGISQQDWMCGEVVINGGRTRDGAFE
jgi:hypothetical protein